MVDACQIREGKIGQWVDGCHVKDGEMRVRFGNEHCQI